MGSICGSGSITNEKKETNSKPPMKVSQLSEVDQAIMQCKQCRDNIKGYIKRLENTSNKKKAKAKEMLQQNDKDRARIYLKQSKFHTEQIKVVSKQLEMVEDQISTIESAQQLSEVSKVLQNGNKVLKSLQEEIKVEKWEAIADDMKDMKEQQDEIGEFFKNHNVNEEEYENAVNADFDKLEKELGLNKVDFPDANNEEIVIQKDNEKEKEKEKKTAVVA